MTGFRIVAEAAGQSLGLPGRGGVREGGTLALTVLFGPVGLLKHGHDVEIKPGQTITAYVDEDTTVDASLAAPPQAD